MTWVQNISAKFGNAGVKGAGGESWFVKNFINVRGYKYTDCTQDQNMQSLGVDYIIHTEHGKMLVDVKTNIKQEHTDYTFAVETWKRNTGGWLYRSRADFIFHVHPTSGLILYYKRLTMKKYIDDNRDNLHEHVTSTGDKFIYLSVNDMSKHTFVHVV